MPVGMKVPIIVNSHQSVPVWSPTLLKERLMRFTLAQSRLQVIHETRHEEPEDVENEQAQICEPAHLLRRKI